MVAAAPESGPAKRAARWRNHLIALGILAAFVLPILIAFWFAVLQPHSAQRALLNHGTLIQPPLDTAADPATAPLARVPFGISDWGLLYYGRGPCAEDCAKGVALLATIRELSGKEGTRVHVIALVDAASSPLANATTIVDSAAREFVARTVAARTGLARETAIVLLDWRGFIMMTFPPDAPPIDIKADLQRLLKASAIH